MGLLPTRGHLGVRNDLSKQGLWITRSTTPDGSAEADFIDWRPLIFENNGVAWHDSGLESSKCHATGLFSSTLKEENGVFWLFYHGYYRHYCFLPLYVFCGQQLLVAYLRPSNIDPAMHARAILRLLVQPPCVLA